MGANISNLGTGFTFVLCYGAGEKKVFTVVKTGNMPHVDKLAASVGKGLALYTLEFIYSLHNEATVIL